MSITYKTKSKKSKVSVPGSTVLSRAEYRFMLTLWKWLVIPYLAYCSQLWSSSKHCLMQELEADQAPKLLGKTQQTKDLQFWKAQGEIILGGPKKCNYNLVLKNNVKILTQEEWFFLHTIYLGNSASTYKIWCL